MDRILICCSNLPVEEIQPPLMQNLPMSPKAKRSMSNSSHLALRNAVRKKICRIFSDLR